MFILFIIAKCISILISVIIGAMFLRMLLPFFLDAEQSRFYWFLLWITEPFILPVRFLLIRFNIGQDSPFDWSFTLTYLLLVIVQWFLPVI